MKTSLFILFTTTIIYLIPNFAQSAVTGSQCQSHLVQVTDILKRENLDSYLTVNDEIPNALGTPLHQLTNLNSQEPAVNNFESSVRTIINDCQSHCGGIIKKNGQKFSCEELKNKTVLDVVNIIKNIDGNFVSPEDSTEPVESVPASNSYSPCANGWETDSCQIFIDSLQSNEERITARATLASSIPECANDRQETDSCQIALDQIFHIGSLEESSSGLISGSEEDILQ